MKHILLVALFATLLAAGATAQIYLGSNGLNVTGSGSSAEVKLGGTLTQHTDIDLNSIYNLRFKNASANALSIFSSGNVGIGTNADNGYKLEVNGTAKVSSHLFVQGATYLQGTLNYVNYGFSDMTNPNAQVNFPGDGSIGISTGTSAPTRQFTVLANGKVGIGTTTPQTYTKLDVAGKVRSETTLFVDRVGGNLTSAFYVYTRDANESSNFGNPLGNGAVEVADFGTAGLIFGSQSGNIAFVGGTGVIGRTFSSGNWYLGNSPADAGYKLNVDGALKTNGLVIPTGASTGKVLTSDANGNASWQTASVGTSGWAFNGSTVGTLKSIGTTDNYDLPVITNGVEQMRITTAGDVGIGTATPQGKLAVNGTIVGKKVKVTQSGWPDFVFDRHYRLPRLDEVDRFIQQNKHLPDVPSAAEVEKQGIDLGDNQAVLLKKIEELTLYIIEDHKRMEAQQQQLLEQQKKIEALEKKLQRPGKH